MLVRTILTRFKYMVHEWADDGKAKILKEYCENRRKDLENIKANGFELGKVNVLLDWMNDRDTFFKLTCIDSVVKDCFLNHMANLIIELALIEEKKDE